MVLTSDNGGFVKSPEGGCATVSHTQSRTGQGLQSRATVAPGAC